MIVNKNCIVFFWIGKNIDIPSALVESIRITMGNEVDIIQLTDFHTEKVLGVSEINRFELSKNIMIARLEAYSKFESNYNEIFYCDADSLFINKLNIPKSANNLLLTLRKVDYIINHNFPEYYPEFEKKTFCQMMPFLFGAIATRGNQYELFKNLLNICNNLPERFHRWYGDQISLKLYMDKNNSIKFDILDQNIFLNIRRDKLSIEDIRVAVEEGTQMITFKGPVAKKYMNDSIISLKNFKGKI